MPTYLNSTSDVITIQGIRLEPRTPEASNIFLQNLPAGVTQTLVTPYFSNILHSEKVTSSKTVTLPTTIIENYKVKIFVSTGEVSMKVNSTDATAIILGIGDTYEVDCSSRSVDNLIFVISTGTAYVTVFKN